jgi:hypothetical protein
MVPTSSSFTANAPINVQSGAFSDLSRLMLSESAKIPAECRQSAMRRSSLPVYGKPFPNAATGWTFESKRLLWPSRHRECRQRQVMLCGDRPKQGAQTTGYVVGWH